MVEISLQIRVSEKVEKEARRAGLFSKNFLQGAIVQELHRRAAARRLRLGVAKFQSLGVNPLTSAEVKKEIEAVRKGRRNSNANRR